MRRTMPLFLILAVLCTGCSQPPEKVQTVIENTVIPDSSADTRIDQAEGYVYLDGGAAERLEFQMLVPQALGIYETGQTVRMADPSGCNLMVLECRPGDSYERCYKEYLHNAGCTLPQNRIKAYEPTTIGSHSYAACRFDARLLTGNEDEERMISYWFIDRPASETVKQACYIVMIETIEENLDAMMCCIQSFVTLSDFTDLQRSENTE